tara:strand:- start:11 stop:1009 length:999 start_codon:yes stop_codon:yes gene_type:complete
MRLTSGGNLLIGTTSESTVGGTAKMTIDVGTGTTSPISIVNGSTDGMYIRRFGTYGKYQLQTNSNGGNSGTLSLQSYGGEVVIGSTTNAGYKLDVSGSFRASQESTFVSNLLFPDNARIKLGNSTDLQIYHDGTDSYINNTTGDLKIRNFADNKDIIFQSHDGTGGITEYFRLDGSTGLTQFPDNKSLAFGTGNDLRIFHGSNASIIDNYNYNLTIRNRADDGDISFVSDNGTGGLAEYIRIDGSQTTVNVYKTLLIGTTTNTGAYKIDVAGKQRVQDTLELDDVLMLNAISTPSDPAAGKSVIYMDSADGGIKCKINVGGTVVERTIASFE